MSNKHTGELHRPHHIDLKTGLYRGKQILPAKTEILAPIYFRRGDWDFCRNDGRQRSPAT